MTTLLTPPAETPDTESLTENEFFESVPPGQKKLVAHLEAEDKNFHGSYLEWEPKGLRLYCTSEQCDGYRSFDAAATCFIKKEGEYCQFVTYVCRNCRENSKQYAISALRVSENEVEMYKFGEVPQFGPPNPPKLMNLMGGERDAYLKGRRCENQGLGIAAFAYYRRVVENQKLKLSVRF